MTSEVRARRSWLPGLPAMGALSEQHWPATIRKICVGVWAQTRRLTNGVLTAQGSRRLKVVETVSLGEKRFVSILHVDGEQFLLAGSASSIVVLAKLDGPSADSDLFGTVLSHENHKTQQSGDHGCDQTSEPGQ